MTGDELRAMIAEIEAKHGSDFDFHVGRVWAMRNQSVVIRILNNKVRWPKQPNAAREEKLEEKRKAARARRQKMHDMKKSGMTHAKIGEAFGISGGRVGTLLIQHAKWLRRQAVKETSE